MEKIKKLIDKIIYYTIISLGFLVLGAVIAFFWWLDHIRFVY